MHLVSVTDHSHISDWELTTVIALTEEWPSTAGCLTDHSHISDWRVAQYCRRNGHNCITSHSPHWACDWEVLKYCRVAVTSQTEKCSNTAGLLVAVTPHTESTQLLLTVLQAAYIKMVCQMQTSGRIRAWLLRYILQAAFTRGHTHIFDLHYLIL